jgi:hypothetical protein
VECDPRRPTLEPPVAAPAIGSLICTATHPTRAPRSALIVDASLTYSGARLGSEADQAHTGRPRRAGRARAGGRPRLGRSGVAAWAPLVSGGMKNGVGEALVAGGRLHRFQHRTGLTPSRPEGAGYLTRRFGDARGMPQRESQPLSPPAPCTLPKLAVDQYGWSPTTCPASRRLRSGTLTSSARARTLSDVGGDREVLEYGVTVDLVAGLQRSIDWIEGSNSTVHRQKVRPGS